MNFAVPLSSGPINVTAPGQVLTITLRGWRGVAQSPFSVVTERVDTTADTISVVTLQGHPLAGWRYWRVYSVGTSNGLNDVIIETGAYDQPAPGFKNYAGYYITKGDVLFGWQQYLQTIQTTLNASQGLLNTLGEPAISLRSSPAGNGPLYKGYFDYAGDFTGHILYNVCLSTTWCN